MGEVRTTSATGGQKGTKPQELAWIDPQSIMQVAEVAEMGKAKYGDHNYRKGYEWSKCYNAMQRHLHAFWGGEDTDEESGLPHLAHASWHCLALLTFMREHPEYDDRYKPMSPPLVVPISGQFIRSVRVERTDAAQAAFDRKLGAYGMGVREEGPV